MVHSATHRGTAVIDYRGLRYHERYNTNARDLRRLISVTRLSSYLSAYVLPSPSDDSSTMSSGSSTSLSSAVVSTSTDPIAAVEALWILCHTSSDSLAMTL